MGIIKLEDVLGWDTKTGVYCTDCDQDLDEEATPIMEGEYDSNEYIVTCDKCHRRLV